MEKRYVYRKHLREPFKYLGTMLLFFILFYMVCAAVTLMDDNIIDDKVLGIIIFSIVGVVITSIIIIEYLIAYFTVFRRFKKINVTLTEDRIIYNNIKGETIIPYEEIIAIEFPSVRYLGGWVKVKYRNGNIKLTVVLENIGDFLKNLKNKLDEMGMSAVYDEKKAYNFYKTAEYSDQSWARVYEYLRYILLAGVINVAIAISLGYLIGGGMGFPMAVAAIILPALAFITAEIFMGRRLAKGASIIGFTAPGRDREFEAKVYKWAFGAFMVLYIVLAALVYI